MILQTKDLYELQNVLDERIFKMHEVTRIETANRRILALLVELGELANETRCFKFWSKKAASEKAVVLEEYVDGIHFLLSIGIDLQHQPEEIAQSHCHVNTSEAFMDIYEQISDYRKSPRIENYMDIFSMYLALGDQLGFTNEDIRSSYFAKNEENHHRQEQNY